MKICNVCLCENIDEAEFCRNCGTKLSANEVKPQNTRPIDDAKIIVKEENNSIISKLFFKNDKYTGKLRIAKTKTISIVVFILFFLAGLIIGAPGVPFIAVAIIAVFFGLIFAVPTYIICFIIGWVMDRLTH